MKSALPASCRCSRPRRPTRCCRWWTGGRKSCSRSTGKTGPDRSAVASAPCLKTWRDPSAEGVAPRRRRSTALPGWIKPQLTKLVDQPPGGPEWLHEIKFDGYRMHARLDRATVRLLTRTGLDWTPKYPAIAAAIASLPAHVLELEALVEKADVVGDRAGQQLIVLH